MRSNSVTFALLTAAVLAALLLPGYGTGQQPQRPEPQRPAPPPPDGQRPDIVVIGDLVNVVFSVFDRRGRFVTNLERENFRVFEDNVEQRIEFFSRETNLPLRIALLLDTSNSMRPRMRFQQEAARDFLHNVVQRHRDQVFLMTFDSEPAVVQDYTDDLNDLQEAIFRQRAGGATSLHDALYEAAERLLRAPLPAGDNPELRRIIVVISDGEDTIVSGRSLPAAIEMAHKAEVAIYAISTNTEWTSISTGGTTKYHKTPGDKVLETLAEETGGRVFFPYRVEDLAKSFLEIGDELRSQYSIAYVPADRTPDGRFRRVKIEVNRRGLNIRGRKGYFAPRPTMDQYRQQQQTRQPRSN